MHTVLKLLYQRCHHAVYDMAQFFRWVSYNRSKPFPYTENYFLFRILTKSKPFALFQYLDEKSIHNLIIEGFYRLYLPLIKFTSDGIRKLCQWDTRKTRTKSKMCKAKFYFRSEHKKKLSLSFLPRSFFHWICESMLIYFNAPTRKAYIQTVRAQYPWTPADISRCNEQWPQNYSERLQAQNCINHKTRRLHCIGKRAIRDSIPCCSMFECPDKNERLKHHLAPLTLFSALREM